MDPESHRLASDLYEHVFVVIAKRRYGNDDVEDQEGGLLPFVFTSDQDGDGLGSIFSKVFRIFAPIAKSAGKSLLKHGVRTAVNVVGDVAQGADWKVAGKRRLEETGDNILGQLQEKVNHMVGSGYPAEVLNRFGKVAVYCPMPPPGMEMNKREVAHRNLLSIEPPPEVSSCRKRRAVKGTKASKKKIKKSKKETVSKSEKKKKKKTKKKKASAQIGNGWL